MEDRLEPIGLLLGVLLQITVRHLFPPPRLLSSSSPLPLPLSPSPLSRPGIQYYGTGVGAIGVREIGIECVLNTKTGSAVYCAVITHDGQKKNGFTECQDDSMNVRGKGKYEPQEGEGDKKHHRERYEQHQKYGHGGRELVSRIDL